MLSLLAQVLTLSLAENSEVTDTNGRTSYDVDPLEARAIERVKSGEVDQYDLLMNRYMRQAYSIAWGIVRNAAEAEDIVQESFVRGLQAIQSFRKGERFGPWIFRIVSNLSLDSARRSRRFPHESFDAAPDLAAGDDPYTQVESSEIGARIESALRELPEMQQLVARLYLVEGLSHGEISLVTGLPEGTLRSHLSHARRKLQMKLGNLHE